MTRSHLQPRTTRIYANNSVYSPAGLLMFRCSDKKIDWYLRKQLAEPIPTQLYDAHHELNARAIRLLFQPRGIGRNRPGDAWYLESQVDRCVVCGRTGSLPDEELQESLMNQASPQNNEHEHEHDHIHNDNHNHNHQVDTACTEEEASSDVVGLTLHHVVPYQYRREMPESFKSHGSHDVLALCTECHESYEHHADVEKQLLVERYDAPLSGRGWIKSPENARVRNASAALLRYKSAIPPDRIAELEDVVVDFYGLLGRGAITTEMLLQALELKAMDKAADFKEHGAIVVEAMRQEEGEAGFARFVRFWRRHFLETMRPRHLSPLWSVDDPVNLVAGEYNPYRPEMDGS